MKRRKYSGGIWQYLDACGVLEHGSDADIKKAKREYRKLYKRQYQRTYRNNHPEYSISFTQDEESIISKAALNHHRSKTAYIKEASLAYTRKLYLVPNPDQLSKLEQLLSLIYQEVKTISQTERNPFEEKSSFQGILRKIEQLELDISKIIRHPPEVPLHHSYDSKAHHSSKT
ncbi:MAG: hypothetical protein IIA45_03785 [Bacteroidetes bacterium]|nr:hypothetical protein [Bacteroidota bacterium]